jgi:hypothetical protein
VSLSVAKVGARKTGEEISLFGVILPGILQGVEVGVILALAALIR